MAGLKVIVYIIKSPPTMEIYLLYQLYYIIPEKSIILFIFLFKISLLPVFSKIMRSVLSIFNKVISRPFTIGRFNYIIYRMYYCISISTFYVSSGNSTYSLIDIEVICSLRFYNK